MNDKVNWKAQFNVRSDNTASRACRFEVSAEQSPKYALYSAETHNLFSSKLLYPFSRNR